MISLNANKIFICIFSSLFIIINLIWLFFDPFNTTTQYNYIVSYLNINIRFALDSISFFFIYLTTLLIPLCLLFSIRSRNTPVTHYYNNDLIFSIGILLLIVFSVFDILIFYISFEAILLPFFIYIGIAGYRQRRIHASYLFFFYTIIGSFFMLISIFFLFIYSGTTYLELLWVTEFPYLTSQLIWIALFFTFSIKVPMFPFHIWLPEAHVEAPTEGSVLLAGLLLKLGPYGMIRFLFPIFPELTYYYAPFVITLASIGIIYTSFITLRQIDIKKIIAYSSIAHMNMVILGLFSFNEAGFLGSIFLMIGHGIVSGGLFFCIGIIYDRYHTKIIHYLSGIINGMPVLSFCLFIFILGNVGLPGTSNFIGELLILCGIAYSHLFVSLIAAAIGIFLCTIYSIYTYNKIIFLMPYKYNIYISDLYLFEYIVLLPLIFFSLYLGVFPNIVLDSLQNVQLYNFINIFI